MSAMEYPDYIDDEHIGEEVSPESIIEVSLTPLSRGERIDKAIAKILTKYSRSKIQDWLEAGLVHHNGMPIDPKAHATGMEMLVIFVPLDPQNAAYQAENIPLEVAYHDMDIAIINKPYGMVVHPAAGNWSGTLLNAILYHFPECSQVPRAGIVHRLDKDTSGLLVIAKNISAQHLLVQQLQDRSMHRKYLALAWGKTPGQKVIHGAIGRDPKDRLKMSVKSTHGKEATTHIKTLAHTSYCGKDISLIACELETGRTHQIRVHLESLGHALVNDPIYKNKIPLQISRQLFTDLVERQIDFPGQFLHAGNLGMIHPSTQKTIHFQSSPPKAFLETLQFLKIPPESWLKEFQECN
jgi:23S rRNA pseudouridine1911/1915/1917 synthase